MNFGQTINEFRRYLWRNNYSKNTVSKYCETINHTLENKDLNRLKQSDLDDIKLELSKRYQINGNRLRYSAINLFCKKVLKRKDLNIKIPKSEARNKDVLTSDEVEKILETAKGEDKTVYAVLQTMYDCALRKMEVCDLDLTDIDYPKMEITLRDTKTGDGIVTMTTRTSEAVRDYTLHERKPKDKNDKALFLNSFGNRIGEHYIRDHLKECAIESGITRRVYPHIFRSSCITHLFNSGINPRTVQEHARHKNFKTTMGYNRPTQQQMKADIERVFVTKSDLDDTDRSRAMFDKYLKGEITSGELRNYLEFMRPKKLKRDSELTGYV